MRKFFGWLLLGMLGACGGGEISEPQLSNENPSPLAATAAEHEGDSPTPTAITDVAPARTVTEQTIAYGEADDMNLVGFLAMPADLLEPQPGVLIIHEWWGLNDNIRAMARRIAGEGYIVLAVDLYGGVIATDTQDAQALMAEVTDTPDRVLDNLRQGINYLEQFAFTPKIASLGWCLGGTWSLQAALTFGDNIDAMVMYYGQVVTDPEELRKLSMPVLGFFGADDSSIPVRDVQAFRSTLTELGTSNQVRIYSNAAHAFANPSGGNYNAEAAEDAWIRTTDFLQTTLR